MKGHDEVATWKPSISIKMGRKISIYVLVNIVALNTINIGRTIEQFSSSWTLKVCLGELRCCKCCLISLLNNLTHSIGWWSKCFKILYNGFLRWIGFPLIKDCREMFCDPFFPILYCIFTNAFKSGTCFGLFAPVLPSITFYRACHPSDVSDLGDPNEHSAGN